MLLHGGLLLFVLLESLLALVRCQLRVGSPLRQIIRWVVHLVDSSDRLSLQTLVDVGRVLSVDGVRILVPAHGSSEHVGCVVLVV